MADGVDEGSAAMRGSVAGTNDLIDRLSHLSVDVDRWGGKTIGEAISEIERLRLAIRRLAEQDATLSVCNGNVTVTMDATLTDAEREAIYRASQYLSQNDVFEGMAEDAATLRGLLERIKHQQT